MRCSAILAAGLGLAALSPLPAPAQPASPPLAYVQPLPPSAVQQVQQRLRQAGVYSGRIDGIWGPDSQAALERFQQTSQLQVTAGDRSDPRARPERPVDGIDDRGASAAPGPLGLGLGSRGAGAAAQPGLL
jgi:peptidoglycan hydrolase-like protein with peptidoglycan-binding domain